MWAFLFLCGVALCVFAFLSGVALIKWAETGDKNHEN